MPNTPVQLEPQIFSFESLVVNNEPTTEAKGDELNVVPPVNAPEPTPPTTPVDPISPLPEDEDSKRTQWSNILHLYKVEKRFPEDVDVPDDLNAEKFTELLFDGVKKLALEEVKPTADEIYAQELNKLIELGHTREQIARALVISEGLASGAEDEEMERYAYLDQMANVEVDAEEDELEVIRRYNLIRNQDPDLIEAGIEKLKGEENKDKRKAAVDQAKTGFIAIRDSQIANVNARKAEEKQKAKEESAKERKSLEAAIDNGFLSVKLQDTEAKLLKKQMFDIAGYRDEQTSRGTERIPETAEAKVWREIWNDPAKRVAIAYFVLNGGVEKISNLLNARPGEKLIKAIEKSNLPGALPKELEIKNLNTTLERPKEGYVLAL